MSHNRIPRPEIPDGHHWCTKCRAVKPVGAFVKNKNTRTGLASWCKECLYANSRTYGSNRQTYWARRKKYGSNLLYVPIGSGYGSLKKALAERGAA